MLMLIEQATCAYREEDKRRQMLGAKPLNQVAWVTQVMCDFVGIMSWPPAHVHNACPGVIYRLWQ